MRTLIAVAALTALAACGQSTTTTDTADTSTSAPTEVAPPPVQTITITEADARSRVEAQGYTNVTGLMQNPDGSWTATGTRNGQTTQLSVGPSGVTATTTSGTPAPTTP